jgi:hypothetical protein
VSLSLEESAKLGLLSGKYSLFSSLHILPSILEVLRGDGGHDVVDLGEDAERTERFVHRLASMIL